MGGLVWVAVALSLFFIFFSFSYSIYFFLFSLLFFIVFLTCCIYVYTILKFSFVCGAAVAAAGLLTDYDCLWHGVNRIEWNIWNGYGNGNGDDDDYDSHPDLIYLFSATTCLHFTFIYGYECIIMLYVFICMMARMHPGPQDEEVLYRKKKKPSHHHWQSKFDSYSCHSLNIRTSIEHLWRETERDREK